MDIQILLDKLASPARRAIQGTGVPSLEGLAELSREEIAGLHDTGKNAIKLIEATLKEFGLTLSAKR